MHLGWSFRAYKIRLRTAEAPAQGNPAGWNRAWQTLLGPRRCAGTRIGIGGPSRGRCARRRKNGAVLANGNKLCVVFCSCGARRCGNVPQYTLGTENYPFRMHKIPSPIASLGNAMRCRLAQKTAAQGCGAVGLRRSPPQRNRAERQARGCCGAAGASPPQEQGKGSAAGGVLRLAGGRPGLSSNVVRRGRHVIANLSHPHVERRRLL